MLLDRLNRLCNISNQCIRKKHGRQILAYTIQALIAMGQEHIALEVATENRNALALYQSCGFKETGSYDYYGQASQYEE